MSGCPRRLKQSNESLYVRKLFIFSRTLITLTEFRKNLLLICFPDSNNPPIRLLIMDLFLGPSRIGLITNPPTEYRLILSKKQDEMDNTVVLVAFCFLIDKKFIPFFKKISIYPYQVVFQVVRKKILIFMIIF